MFRRSDKEKINKYMLTLHITGSTIEASLDDRMGLSFHDRKMG